MSSKNILELTVCLSQALDQNYDVVDMDAVLAVIAALEGTTITKEQLEATRLAKYINQLRRRTKSGNLAKRSKSLLKKWREMVGIQQSNDPSNVNALTVSTDNLMATNIQHHHHHRSQPTSPVININAESMTLSKSNAPQADYLRSASSNPAPVTSSFNPRSANLNVYNSNKRLDLVEGQSGASGSSTTMPMDSTKQPTSFANLINFNNDNSFSNAKVNKTLCSGSASSRFARNKSNKAYDRLAAQPTETFIVDQSSNSNSEISFSTSNVSNNVAPIVIDIQDSNSGSIPTIALGAKTSEIESGTVSNKAAPTNWSFKAKNLQKTEPEISASGRASLENLSANSKPKKTKKEKRRKERENFGEISSIPAQVPTATVVIDETSNPKTQDGRPSSVVKDKSRHIYPAYNISEILSLSNSSMSSMFPTDGASRVLDDQNRYSLNASNSGMKSNKLSNADLTFAGKFKQHNTLTATANNNDALSVNETVANRSDSPNVPPMAVPTSYNHINSTPNKIIRFTGSGCNSNDSTSNSRASHFEIIDVNNHEHNKLKAVQDTCSLKLNDASSQNAQQKINATLPPTVHVGHLQQTADTTTLNSQTSVVTPEKKIPKKRGRKKGSKGVDSVIAKETSLSSQMLITSLGSGGKKVKTTKELYAEMQNRKLGISTNTSSPTLTNLSSQPPQLASRAESTCSEPSLHSPRTLDACSTNATVSTVATRSTPENYLANTNADEVDSDSDTITSEPSRDSVAAQKKMKRFLSVDSNSNSLFKATKTNESKNSAESISTAAIEKQLIELMRQLPPVPNIETIEAECAAELVPCTCLVIEVLPLTEGDQKAKIEDDIDGGNQDEAVSSLDEDKEAASKQQQHQEGENTVNVVEIVKAQSKAVTLVAPGKPIKSIFDLDFDDDDDPLHTIMAEAAAASAMQEQCAEETLPAAEPHDDKGEFIKQTSTKHEVEPQTTACLDLILPQTTDIQPMPIFPTYQVEEDIACIAKQRFEIRTQNITKFHIDALHNCFIPNINGNWDNADTPNMISADSCMDEPLSIDGNDVVPKYGSLVSENLCKDLSHVTFTKNFKPKKQSFAMKKLYSLPFLGIARITPTQRKTSNNCVCQKGKYASEARSLSAIPLSSVHKTSEESQTHCSQIASIIIPSHTGVTVHENQTQSEINITGTCSDITNQKCSQVLGTNVSFRDIMIDVSGPDNLLMVSNKSSVDEPKSRNLLAIADVSNVTNYAAINDSTEICNKVKLNELTLYEKQNEQNTKNFSRKDVGLDMKMCGSNSKDKSDSGTLTTAYENADDKTSSRRSSSCSNSSLKQTQQSINLKLRLQRLLQQKEQKLVGTNGRKRSRNRSNTNHAEVECNKRNHIKRIKIAINGDVATQRQISFGSINNSTDEEENCEADYDGYNDNEKYESPLSSTASYSNSVFDEDEYNAFSECENTGGDDFAAGAVGDNEVDDYEFEEDDEEDYSGDFHEVVTRDISAPSTGSNHIVLTIKKTPSKTNSPSNSLSAISPLIATTANTAAAVTTALVTTAINNFEVADSQHLVNVNRDDNPNETNATEAVLKLMTSNSKCYNATVAPIITPITANTGQAAYCSADKTKQLTLKRLQQSVSADYKVAQKRIRRKLKKLRPIRFPGCINSSNATIDKKRKLHHRLFFPHELYTNTPDGDRESLLNISSCSSSCSEENDEYEYYASWALPASLGRQINEKDSRQQKSAESMCNACEKTVSELLDETGIDAETETLNVLTTDIKEATDFTDTRTASKQSLKTEPVEIELKLEEGNNGLLVSFNNICCPASETKTVISRDVTDANAPENEMIVVRRDSDYLNKELPDVDPHRLKEADKLKLQLRNVNCDDYNLYNNNNNFNLIKYNSKDLSLVNNARCRNICKHSSSSSDEQVFVDGNETASTKIDATVKHSNNNINNSCNNANIATNDIKKEKLIPHREYRTGLRAVDEDVDDDDGNNCARIQRFKEWHQVLQLRSYNDELLTVLPYVVLD